MFCGIIRSLKYCLKFTIIFVGFLFFLHTRVNDLLILTEGHSRASPLPLGSLDVQVAFLDGQSRYALVVCCVELGQVLREH